MRPDTDIAILGAGCAGLSLAAALGMARVPGHVCLMEPRITYKRDRTWCFWNTEEHPFVSAISHAWARWRVSSGSQHALQGSDRYKYCHIAGDAFYRAALESIDHCADQELCRGVSIDSVEPHHTGYVAVETNQGRLLARHVFDSRPPVLDPKASPALLQRFMGWHVRASEPRFDPATVELMKFLPSDVPGRVRFLYLLPFSVTEALVEMTYLDDPGLPEPPYEADLRQSLQEHACDWEVLYTEQGSLPMQASRPISTSDGRVHSIGMRGGRIKPSSGYGFLRIQRHSRSIARSLAAGSPIPTSVEPHLYSTMDNIFLRALRNSNTAVPALFLRMFARTDADALVRFLSETSAPDEMLRVAWSLPKLPLLKAALQSARTVPYMAGAGK